MAAVMKLHPLYPLTFRPIYKDYPWGGTAIAARYNRGNTPGTCAESRELSGVPEESSIVTNGVFEGESLTQLAQTFGRELLGTKAPTDERFPLMIKLMHVRDRLSLQVHPKAPLDAALPKHKLWYLLDAQPQTTVWAGTTEGATPENLADHLHAFSAKRGDLFDLPSGLVHSVGGEALVYELCQAGGTKFRLDDWGRGRELQRDAAVEGIDWASQAQCIPPPEQPRRDLHKRLTTPDFTFATLTLSRTRSLHTTAQSFMVLFCTEGKTTLDHNGPHPLTLMPGDLVLVPPKQRVTLHPLAPTHLLINTL